jgi:NitT/TauT family transport system substrate-binding protein
MVTGPDQTRRGFLKASGGIVTAATTLAAPNLLRAAPLKKVTFVIQYFARGDYAEYYLALDRGYYAKRGLDVTIKHVLGNALAYQTLSDDKAAFAHADIVQMLQLQGKSPKPQLLLVADIADKLALSLFFLKGRGIVHPKDLEGKTIVDSPGSTTPFIFKLFAEKNGIDPKKVNWLFTAATNKSAMMLQGKADAVATYLPGLASLKAHLKPGQDIGYFMFGEYGVDIYGDGLITRKDYWDNDDGKATAKAFVAGSLDGCKDAFADPAAAVDALRKYHPEVNRETGIEEEKLMAKSCLQQHGLGYIDPGKMQRTYNAVVNLLGQPIPKPVTAYYTSAALPARLPDQRT